MVFKIIMTLLMLILIFLLILITIVVATVLNHMRRQAIMRKGIRRIMEVKGIKMVKIGSFSDLRSALQALTDMEIEETSEEEFRKQLEHLTRPKSIKDIIKRKD